LTDQLALTRLVKSSHADVSIDRALDVEEGSVQPGTTSISGINVADGTIGTTGVVTPSKHTT